MAGLQALVGDGAIIVFGGGPSTIPANFLPPPTPTSAGDQPATERAQNYPQLRGIIVSAATFVPEMGVSVDALTQ